MTAVCHITSVHPSDDPRIFHKECVSLARAGYDVTLVAPGASREEAGVRVIGCGEKPAGRVKRAFIYARHVVDVALTVPAEVVHLHDPELLLQVGRLRRAGRLVIFDSHEDYGVKKAYLSGLTAELVRRATLAVERHAASKLAALICCYEKTRERLSRFVDPIAMIYNFPIVDAAEARGDEAEGRCGATPNQGQPTALQGPENGAHPPAGDVDATASPADARAATPWVIGYAGGIKPMWHLKELLAAVAPLEGVTVKLAGIAQASYLEELTASTGWAKVDYRGTLPFGRVRQDIYGPAQMGVALLDYIPAYNGKEGNLSNTKLFEILYAGLPIVATDFRAWREVIEGEDCGVCVDPNDVDAIRAAIETLRADPARAAEMGQRARRAVIEKYNWAQEEKKLLALYETVLGRSEEE